MKYSETAYYSAENKTESQALLYTQTHDAPHRFLAYRDIRAFIRKHVKGNSALDHGAGTGASSSFLQSLAFNVTGIDISLKMLEKARTSFPSIQFTDSKIFKSENCFDLIFSSFVLFELPSKNDIIEYLVKSRSFMKKNGVFIGITGSEHLYSPMRQWFTFDANFPENSNLRSGSIAKLLLKQPEMEFHDYFWKLEDYTECFEKAGFKILNMHFPLGLVEDRFPWLDELTYSPFVIFVATPLINEPRFFQHSKKSRH